MALKQRFNHLGFHSRVLLFVFLPLLVLTTTIAFLLFAQLEDWVEKRMQEDVELVARSLRFSISHALERDRPGSLGKSLETTLQISRLYGASVYDAKGKMVATAGELSLTPNDDPDIDNLLSDDGRTGSYGEIGGRAVYSYFVPLRDSAGETVGLLQVARLHRDMLDSIRHLRVVTLGILAGVTALMGAFVFAGYHGAVGGSLKQLTQAMAKVTKGDRRHRAAPKGPREIAALTLSFNQMLDAINGAEEEIARGRQAEARLQEDLQKKEHLAGIGRVAAGIAHELGTPLGVVDGKAQRALRNQALDSNLKGSLESIRAEVRRMESIVRQLLEFGRSHDNQKRPLRISFLLGNALRAVEQERAQARTTISVDQNLDAPVFVNPLRLELALVNLLKNAVQAAPGGQVNIACELRQASAVIFVQDDGPGISPDLRENLFEPFVTTRRSEAGTGLGLAIAQQVAVESGGALMADNHRSGGALFTLSLPLAPPA